VLESQSQMMNLHNAVQITGKFHHCLIQ